MKAKLCTVLSAALMCAAAHADRIDDLHKQGRKAYCEWASSAFIQGATARLENIPLVLYSMPSQKVKLDAGAQGIYVANGDAMTEQEYIETAKNISYGWIVMDSYLLSHPKTNQDDGPRIVGMSIKDCMSRTDI